MFNLSSKLSAAASLLAACAIAGCAQVAPQTESQFGLSLNLMKQQQTINPDGARDTRVVGMDGQAAGAALERYNKSYRAPTPQPNVFTIGVGSSSSQ